MTNCKNCTHRIKYLTGYQNLYKCENKQPYIKLQQWENNCVDYAEIDKNKINDSFVTKAKSI